MRRIEAPPHRGDGAQSKGIELEPHAVDGDAIRWPSIVVLETRRDLTTIVYRSGCGLHRAGYSLALNSEISGLYPLVAGLLSAQSDLAVPCSREMLLSIIIPVYNEEESLHALMERLRPALRGLGADHELIFVNDGSSDETGRILSDWSQTDRRIKVLTFSRNFGHQAAITAGLDFADGEAVAVMDADLQDPPELLPDMLRLLQQGYDVVSAQRQARPGDGHFKRWTAAGFYWFMRRYVDPRLTPEVGDFRMFSRSAVLGLRQFREQHRFMRGLVAWLGLKEVILPFRREERTRGTTKYPLFRMLQLAWTGVSSFSALPLRLSTNLGMIVTLFGVFYFLYSLFVALIAKTTIHGWTSLVCLQIIFSGTILMALGVLGSYVARIYEESKQRPLYIVASLSNLPRPAADPQGGLVLDKPGSGAKIAEMPVARRMLR